MTENRPGRSVQLDNPEMVMKNIPMTTHTQEKIVTTPVEFVVATEAFEFKAPPRNSGYKRARKTHQQEMDVILQEGYGKSHVALAVAPEHYDAMVKRIRNSATYLNLGIRLGEPVLTDDDNIVGLVFKVTDKIIKTRKPKTSE